MLAYPPMKRSLAVLLAGLAPLAIFPAFAAPPAGAFSAKLAVKDSHQECVHLDKGEKRNYSWSADGPVDFDIHRRDAVDPPYPVKVDGMRGDGGTFAADAAGDYCWTWAARDRPVKVEGRIAK